MQGNANKLPRTQTVPKSATDPIQHLLDSSIATPAQLAVAWGFRSTDTVYRLKRYEYTPKPRTAALMAASFGWTTLEVLNHWIERVGVDRKAAR